jgi:hypothetical protein
MRGQTSTNDYQDLVFLITKYHPYVNNYSSRINKEHRLAFLQKYAETNAQNTEVVKWMRQILGLVEDEEGSRQQQPR